MSSREGRVNPLWYILGLVVVGFLAWEVLKFLFGILFFVIVGAVVVGAFVMLAGKGRRSIGGRGRRGIDR